MSIFERQVNETGSIGGSNVAEVSPVAEEISTTEETSKEAVNGSSFSWKHVEVATACAHCNSLLSNQYGVVGEKNPSLFYCQEDCFRAANGMKPKSKWPIKDKE